MVQSERLRQMKAALVDFLIRAYQVPHLQKIILFGSLLEGDVNKKSDIDLMLVFDTKDNPEIGIELKIATRIGLEVLKDYQIENNFSFVVINIQYPSKTDKEFLRETADQGIIVWQRGGFDFLKDHREVSSQILFSYSTRTLSSANKRKLLRKITKMIKLYGEKLGKGVVLVEKKREKETEKIFKESEAFYKKLEIFR